MRNNFILRNSLAIGRGVLLIGNASSHISNTSPCLVYGSNYIGYTTSITLDTINEVRQTAKAGSEFLTDVFTNLKSLTVACTALEITPRNVLISLGGNGLALGSTLDASFPFNQPGNTWRLEIYFKFPNVSGNTMRYIIPKAKIVSSIGLSFVTETPIGNSMSFQAISAIDGDVRHVNWADAPLGKIVFSS